MLAIVWTVKYFRPYLFGRKFTIITDHKPLQWLFSMKDPSSKLLRWRLKMEEYDYNIVYKKGALNTNADALSRIELNNNESEPQPRTSGTQNRPTAIEEYDDDLQSILPQIEDMSIELDFDDLINSVDLDFGRPIDDANETVHSSEQKPTVGIPISESPVNQGANQIIISKVPH